MSPRSQTLILLCPDTPCDLLNPFSLGFGVCIFSRAWLSPAILPLAGVSWPCLCLSSSFARSSVPALSHPETMGQPGQVTHLPQTQSPGAPPWTIFSAWRWSQKRIFHSRHNGCPGPLSSSDRGILPASKYLPCPYLLGLPACSSPPHRDIASWGCERLRPTMKQHVSSLGDMTTWNPFPLLAGTPGIFGCLEDWRPRKGCALSKVTERSAWRLHVRPGSSGCSCLGCLPQC